MGLFERLERGLERAVNGAFAKAFKSSVQPVEIASAMRRAMDDRAAATSRITGRTGSTATVPNMFTVELSTSDYDDLTAYADDLTDELLASAEEHIDSQRYKIVGPIRIIFAEDTALETGVFTLRPASAHRPFDITPDGLADRSSYAEHGYEEFEELSIGIPVARAERPARPEPESPYARPATGQGAGASGSTAGAPWARDDEQQQAPTPAPPAAPPVVVPERAPHELPVQRQAAAPVAARPDPEATAPHEPPKRKPAPVRRPWLDIDGDRYPLLGAITVIGRDHTADIVLDDPGISRRHAEIRVTFDGPHPVISLNDLGSTNGCFVNGERATSGHLDDGDRLTLGRSTVIVRTGRGR